MGNKADLEDDPLSRKLTCPDLPQGRQRINLKHCRDINLTTAYSGSDAHGDRLAMKLWQEDHISGVTMPLPQRRQSIFAAYGIESLGMIPCYLKLPLQPNMREVRSASFVSQYRTGATILHGHGMELGLHTKLGGSFRVKTCKHV